VSLGVPENVTTHALVLYNRYLTAPIFEGAEMVEFDEIKNRQDIKDVTVTVYNMYMDSHDRKYGDFITSMSVADEID
jgi:hypothetical protein